MNKKNRVEPSVGIWEGFRRELSWVRLEPLLKLEVTLDLEWNLKEFRVGRWEQ